MAIIYPTGFDIFGVPSLPEDTSLSSAGTSTRDHTENHADLGNAVMALQVNAAPIAHDHSDAVSENALWPTPQLLQINTHQQPDTDLSVVGLHHTLGYGATQAAAGNHSHDYEGPSIYNKPWVICQSTTRPTDPVPAEMIYELDTNCVRAWTAFPNNVLVGSTKIGVNYTYNFDTNNNATFMDPAVFAQTYQIGGSPTFGHMGCPEAHSCEWDFGDEGNCSCVAQSVAEGATVTASDDQVLTFTTGTKIMDGRDEDSREFRFWHWEEEEEPSPTNDVYLRMSADGRSYVRFCLYDAGCFISVTNSNAWWPGEVFLGGVHTGDVFHPSTTWTAKAIGAVYTLYANGVRVLSAVDYENIANVGAGFRGWGIGMSAADSRPWHGHSHQLLPANFTSVNIQDAYATYTAHYATEFIWQLLPVAMMPHIRAEAHFEQVVLHGPKGCVIGFDTILEDWTVTGSGFTNLAESQTDFTIKEAGHYHVHMSVPWDFADHDFDQTGLGISVNNQDVGRKSVCFRRGNGFAPGYPQTHDLFFSYYFAQGDVVRVWAQHNASRDQHLFHHNIPPNVFSAWITYDFIGP